MTRSVDQLKAELREIAQRRRAVESEIAERTLRLESAGVGLHGSLVDQEGFPRAGIDIPGIRADRQRVIVLTNDHKALSSQLEQLLHELHALTREQPGAPSTPGSSTAAQATQPATRPPSSSSHRHHQNGVAHPQLAPFAVVDELFPNSPASRAGVQLGDRLLKFGGVASQGGPSTLQQVAAELQACEGREVEAVFLRGGVPLTLRLLPQQWGGRGLLGCHLRPL